MEEQLKKLLQGPSVHTRDGAVEKVLKTAWIMREQGREKLAVISDFDMTLTHYYVNGGRGRTSFSVIETSELMPEIYRNKVAALRVIYAPKEVDPHLSERERREYMDEWYSQAHNLLVEFKVKKSDLEKFVKMGNIKLREGCETFFDLLHSVKVPLIIVSAGIADTLILTIEEQASMKDNISVISNYFQFDPVGVATGFSETMITSSKKGDLHDQFSALSQQLQGRSNVVLVGDSLGDPQMVSGMERLPEHVLKIGFLNHDVEKLLPTYLDLYDVVLTGDCDMTLVNNILQFIVQWTY